jgi:hypothetical protein
LNGNLDELTSIAPVGPSGQPPIQLARLCQCNNLLTRPGADLLHSLRTPGSPAVIARVRHNCRAHPNPRGEHAAVERTGQPSG